MRHFDGSEEIDDNRAARDRHEGRGAGVLGDGELTIGVHGNPVPFLYPEDVCGTAGEPEQAQ